ncbi:MAG TPA: SUMF1/EgtB/PvdO family nonheme iron enzyme, partial [Candidatus Kapabacteria bacterium]|nr:SUMF1/EgtB/PvdO family nonheme iron enzyme [Candidatus Kapabacteria bacterium]
VVFLKNIWPIFQEEISSKKTDITFKSLLQKYFETHLGGTLNFEEVKRFLSRERALFLIDGLDEVPERLRCSLVELIVTFRVEYINNHFLLTSRPHGIDAGIMSYLGEYLCDIEYLDKKKINEFISNLLKVVSRQNVDYARVSVTEMISDIKFHKHADVFTRNPLFLTALCFFYLENGKQLPIQRADLYDSIIRNFLSRRFNDLSDPEKVTRIEDYLKHLAFLMQEQDRKIIEVGKAKELLKEYFPHKDESPSHYKIRIDNLYAEIEPRCGLLKCTCEAELEFIHSTFQEFMAAWHMLYTDTDYKKYLKNSGWHETILFYTSLISREHKERANLMVNEFLSNPPNDTDGTQKLWLLGAKVLRDIQPNRRDSKVIYLAREKMKTILESEAPLEERFEAGEILGILGDDRIKSYPIVVNGGAFFRGSNKYKWEKPSGNIDLDGFMMAKYPVTNTEFACFIQDGGYNNKDFWCSDGWTWKEIKKISAPMFWYDRKWNGLNFPVVGVNWYEAKAYTMWLNKKTGDEYTLPTEAQWEKAARGSEGFIYPWGKEFNKNLCNTSESRLNRTSPVGIFPGGKSPFGCFDMAGNVWEWCLDWYDEYYYKNSPGKNPEGPVSGNFRVIRGGSWFNEAWRCLGSFRDYDEPEDRLNCLGFRLVKKLKVTDINATPNINGDSIVVKPANNNFQDHEKVFKDELKGQSVKVELFKKREEDRKSVKKILIISSNPKTTPRIQFDEEIKEIEEALGRSKYRDQFEILSKLRVSFKVLRRALLDHDPQIVHFIGHGNEDGLLLEDEFGLAVPISPEVLSGLFKLFSDKVEFIILNACYSELQANVIIEHINYVIGMRGEIKDKASIEFTVGFYDALGAGKSVEESFKFGCNAIQQMFPNLPEHLIPILKKRGNLRKL